MSAHIARHATPVVLWLDVSQELRPCGRNSMGVFMGVTGNALVTRSFGASSLRRLRPPHTPGGDSWAPLSRDILVTAQQPSSPKTQPAETINICILLALTTSGSSIGVPMRVGKVESPQTGHIPSHATTAESQ